MAHLFFDGCDTVVMAKQYGTPLYVLSEAMLRQRLKTIKSEFLNKYENCSAVFASKALQTVEICRIVASEGIGLDVVSGGELYTALKAGFPMDRVFLHGNNKTLEELSMALDYKVGHIVVDNADELHKLNRLALEKGVAAPVLFRITPGVDSHTHEFISTGHVDSKFGIPLERSVRDAYIGEALRMKGIQLLGFHFHVGSQLHTHESHRKAIEVLIQLMQEVSEEYGFETKILNIGGGFSVKYNESDNPKPLSYYVDTLMSDITSLCAQKGLAAPHVVIEPGRWVTAEAGITLYTVGSRKEVPDYRIYIGIDGGMPDNPRPALYGARYDASVANKHEQPRDTLVTVAGKCCESGDILIKDISLQDPKDGDILAVFTTGAYNFSMASNYNRIPRPAMVFTNNGEHRLVVRRETYDDLLLREL